jgi:hypothetical protein
MEKDYIALVLLWFHISGAILFGIGLVGTFISSSYAGQENDIKTIQSLLKLSKRFGRLIDVGGAFLIFAGLLLAWRENEPIIGFLQGSDENWLLASILLFVSTFPVILLGYMPREKLVNKELETALRKQKVTPELKDAFSDKVLKYGRIYEIAIFALVVFLMAVKPF